MQNMQQQISAETVLNLIWQHMDLCRGYGDIYTNILTVLYAYHKGYTIHKIQRYVEFVRNDDALLNDLINASSISKIANDVMYSILNELEHIDHNHYNKIYPEVLSGLFDRISSSAGHASIEFYTPQEITKLMAFILNKENCTSIYDPFCGTASLANELSSYSPNTQFEGQELNHRTALYARVNLEATYGSDFGLHVCDSTIHWSNKHFDAVASCPPFNLRLSTDQQRGIANLLPHIYCSSIEEMLLNAPFSINKAKLSMVLTTTGFCFRGANGGIDYESRRHLVEQNLLDTIIALPSNILYGTSIPCVMVICKRFRKEDDPITFIHADDYYLGDRRKRTLDVNRLIDMMKTTREDCVKVKLSEVRNYDYNLNPSLYVKKDFDLKEGQQVVRLGDLITLTEGERIIDNNEDNIVSLNNLSRDFIEILLNNSKVSASAESRRNVRYRYLAASSKKYLLAHTAGMESKYGLFTDGKSFTYPVDIKVYEVNESLVTPEYLAFTLANNSAIKKSRLSLSAYLSFPIVIDSVEQQKELVNKLKQQYTAKINAETEADAKRLGIKQNISDLEHMLGSTQLRIGKIIKRLESYTPDMDNYQQVVKQLKDNVEYMNRIIRYSNANIDKDSIYRKSDDLLGYITSYVDAWINYGSNCFELTVINELDENPSISFDRNMLTVMFDSILNNAVRHGFNKRKMEGNSVQIRLSLVEREAKPFVLISVANNGTAMADGFTIDDFISRGRFSASSGRSGLGGFHTHQIVKGHDGFLYLDSNKQWSVIVEVLLPLDSSSINNIPEYDHECI